MGLWSMLCAPQRGNVVAPELRTQVCEQPEKPTTKLQVVVGSNDASGPTSPPGRSPKRPVEGRTTWSIGATKISCSSPIDTAIKEGEELLAKAALPDASWSLPVVSLASLEAAFKHSPQAVAVVKLSHQPTTPRCSTAGLAFSTPASPKAPRPPALQKQPTQGPDRFTVQSSQHSFNSNDGAGPSSSSCSGGVLNASLLNKRMSAAHRLMRMPSSRRCSFAVHAAPQPGELARESVGASTVQWDLDELPEKASQLSTCPTRPASRFGSAMSRPTSAHVRTRSGSEEPGAQLAQLEPVFLNDPLSKMLGIMRLDEYAQIMDRQLLRNPMMVMLFENSVRRLLAGKATSVRQYIPHVASDISSNGNSSSSSGGGRGTDHSSTTFINLCITACALKEDVEEGRGRSSSGGGSVFSDDSAESAGVSSATPALFLWYDLPSSQAELTSQLKRDYMALSHIPSMVSVLAFDGRVLHQNGCSVAYMGFVMNTRFSRPAHINDREHTLRRLFVLEPDALEDLLATLADNKTWHGLVKMPAHLDLTEPVTPAATSFSGATAEMGQLEAGTPRSPTRFGPQRSNPSSTRSTREDIGPDGKASGASSSARSTREDAPAVCGLGGGSIPASARSTAEDFAMLCSISENGGSSAASPAGSPTAGAAVVAGSSGGLGKTQHGSTGGASAAGGGPRSWASSSRSTRQSVSTGGVPSQPVQSPSQVNKQRRTSWHLPGKPFLEACQKIVLGNRASSTGGGQTSPSSLRTKQGNAGRTSRVVQLARESQEAVLQQAAAMAGSEGTAVAEEARWHQIQASKFQDPVTGADVIMFIQTDASARVRAEELLGHVLDAEHALLEEVFPRQVLETMTAAAIRSSLAKGLVSTAADVDCHPLLLAQNAQNTRTIATHHEQVSIMFADIVGFTTMAKHVEPVAVMTFLNDLYTKFDALLGEHSVYKVETIGDCYMVAGGLVFTDAQGYTSVMQSKVDPLHAKRVFSFAQAMLRVAGQVNMPDTGLPVRLRVGIHSGPVVSGVVGTRMPRFCLFGDTVNTANRMESTASPNSIHVSDITQSLIGGDCWEATGGVQLKGRGMMESFTFWSDRQSAGTPSAAAATAAAHTAAAHAAAAAAAPATQAHPTPARAAAALAAATPNATPLHAVPGRALAAAGVKKAPGR